MSASIHVKRGETLQLPVAPGHPLAKFQSVRAATLKDLIHHPFYSKVIEHRMNISKVQLVRRIAKRDTRSDYSVYYLEDRTPSNLRSGRHYGRLWRETGLLRQLSFRRCQERDGAKRRGHSLLLQRSDDIRDAVDRL